MEGKVLFFRVEVNFYNYNVLQNNSFISNTATKSGGALKLLFIYEELNPVANDTSVFINNSDSKGQAIDAAKLSAYTFSFYDIIVAINDDDEENLESWVSNSSLTTLAASFNVSTADDSLENFTVSHKSGHVLDQILVIEIYDQNGLLADYIDDE